jgi:hypothetical protein
VREREEAAVPVMGRDAQVFSFNKHIASSRYSWIHEKEKKSG